MKNYLPDQKAPTRIPDPTMSESLELRWFIEDCPVLGGWPSRSEARLVEHLYAFPCGVKWGSKLREGALELKTRRGKPTVCEMGDCCGQLEIWQKRVLALPEGEPPDLGACGWIKVGKRRAKRLFEFEDGTLREVAAARTVANGCLVECTELQVEGEDAGWTFALDAFGDQALRRAVLEEAFQAIHSTVRRMDMEDAMGYPEWLNLRDALG